MPPRVRLITLAFRIHPINSASALGKGKDKLPAITKLLIISGLILIGLGLLFYLAGKVPSLGKLPGDIYIHKKNFVFYFPLATCVLLSLLLTLIFWLFPRR